MPLSQGDGAPALPIFGTPSTCSHCLGYNNIMRHGNISDEVTRFMVDALVITRDRQLSPHIFGTTPNTCPHGEITGRQQA